MAKHQKSDKRCKKWSEMLPRWHGSVGRAHRSHRWGRWFESNCHHQAQALVDQGLASFYPPRSRVPRGTFFVGLSWRSLTKVPYCIVAFVVESVWLFCLHMCERSGCRLGKRVCYRKNNSLTIFRSITWPHPIILKQCNPDCFQLVMSHQSGSQGN